MLAVRFLPSASKASLESNGDATLLNLDLKLQVSVANLLEVLLKSQGEQFQNTLSSL